MPTLQTPKPLAEKVRSFIVQNNLFDRNFKIAHDKKFIYFPLTDKGRITKEFPFLQFVKKRLEQNRKQQTAHELLKNKLAPKEYALLPRSYDSIGNILILELPKELQQKEKIIADIFLKAHKEFQTAVRKSDIHSGIFRTREVKVLAGKNTKETIHRENGLLMHLNIEKAYFTPRLAEERMRIAEQVKPGEHVLVMFSGVGPYVLAIAKHSEAQQVIGIEINPTAHKYAQENAQINNLAHKAQFFCGDVRKVLPKLKEKFDRIVMPLPKTGEQFLPLALKYLKKGGMLNYYHFLREDEVGQYKKEILWICRKNKKSCFILSAKKCGEYKPHVFRVVFDAKVR